MVVVDTMGLTRTADQGRTDPERVELSRDERTLFATAEDAAKMVALDITRGKVTAIVPVGREPEGVRLSPNGQWLVVTSETDNNVAIIDPATHKVLETVLVGVRPRDIAFTTDSSTAFVTGRAGRLAVSHGTALGCPATQLLQLRKEAANGPAHGHPARAPLRDYRPRWHACGGRTHRRHPHQESPSGLAPGALHLPPMIAT